MDVSITPPARVKLPAPDVLESVVASEESVVIDKELEDIAMVMRSKQVARDYYFCTVWRILQGYALRLITCQMMYNTVL